MACFKLLVAAALSLAPSPAARVYAVAFSQVKQVACGNLRGTAFVADHHLVSVNHVTSAAGCKINGQPIHAVREGDKDFSDEPSPYHGLKIDCSGYHVGERVWAIGYALGLPVQTAIPLIATGEFVNDHAILFGSPTVIPGMSGGPIINERAEVVGLVNTYYDGAPYSGSVQLKDTALCR